MPATRLERLLVLRKRTAALSHSFQTSQKFQSFKGIANQSLSRGSQRTESGLLG